MWSPDGRKIAFQRVLVRREGDKIVGVDFDVYVINADGSEERNLTRDALSLRPIWSPDGRKIAFASGPDGDGGIYVMNADGSERRLLAWRCIVVAIKPHRTGGRCWSFVAGVAMVLKGSTSSSRTPTEAGCGG